MSAALNYQAFFIKCHNMSKGIQQSVLIFTLDLAYEYFTTKTQTIAQITKLLLLQYDFNSVLFIGLL